MSSSDTGDGSGNGPSEASDVTDHQPLEGGGDDDDMNELMSNRDFIRSVLSSLPGVNPEEALQNLEEMTEQQEKGEDHEGDVSWHVHVDRCDVTCIWWAWITCGCG